jgi:hypothetical protein
MPTPEHTQVFISYSHDSREHMDRVLTLSNRLDAGGIDCHIDQYEESPAEGWPRWMVDQIEDVNSVLVVCTETYEGRFRGRDKLEKVWGTMGGGNHHARNLRSRSILLPIKTRCPGTEYPVADNHRGQP